MASKKRIIYTDEKIELEKTRDFLPLPRRLAAARTVVRLPAVERSRRRRFLQEVNAAYARLRKGPKALRAFQKELRAWDHTLAD